MGLKNAVLKFIGVNKSVQMNLTNLSPPKTFQTPFGRLSSNRSQRGFTHKLSDTTLFTIVVCF